MASTPGICLGATGPMFALKGGRAGCGNPVRTAHVRFNSIGCPLARDAPSPGAARGRPDERESARADAAARRITSVGRSEVGPRQSLGGCARPSTPDRRDSRQSKDDDHSFGRNGRIMYLLFLLFAFFVFFSCFSVLLLEQTTRKTGPRKKNRNPKETHRAGQLDQCGF